VSWGDIKKDTNKKAKLALNIVISGWPMPETESKFPRNSGMVNKGVEKSWHKGFFFATANGDRTDRDIFVHSRHIINFQPQMVPKQGQSLRWEHIEINGDGKRMATGVTMDGWIAPPAKSVNLTLNPN